MFHENPEFDYDKEPVRDILCIDCKSFYASVEAVERGLNPLIAKLVVMSYPSDNTQERGSGLILASSPQAKKAYNITNVSRARDLPFPYPKDLHIVPPRMFLYMRKNMEINNIYRQFVSDDSLHVYSVDESFLDVTDSMRLFNVDSAYEMARLIQIEVYKKTGIFTTVGIGENMLLAKLALDNEAKHKKDMKAEWTYDDVPAKLWKLDNLEDFWGIGRKTAIRLRKMGISSIYDLAHADYYQLKERLGVMGVQLYAHAWGIDRSFVNQKVKAKSKSIGNSQVLTRDYQKKTEIEVVIKEMADQVATRLRSKGAKASVISLGIGYSLAYVSVDGKTGFHQQMKVHLTNKSTEIAEALLTIFRKHYTDQAVRTISVNTSGIVFSTALQLDLFEDTEKQVDDAKVDFVVDAIRKKYGFKSIVHATSMLDGATALSRAGKVGGHSGGMSGIDGGGLDD